MPAGTSFTGFFSLLLQWWDCSDQSPPAALTPLFLSTSGTQHMIASQSSLVHDLHAPSHFDNYPGWHFLKSTATGILNQQHFTNQTQYARAHHWNWADVLARSSTCWHSFPRSQITAFISADCDGNRDRVTVISFVWRLKTKSFKLPHFKGTDVLLQHPWY